MKCYAIENHPNDSRVTMDPAGIVQTLSSRMGTGGNNTPFVLITSTSPDLRSGNHTKLQASGQRAEALETAEKELCVCSSSDNSAPVEAYCAGNGQLHQIPMTPVCNCLDCMHDQQMIVIKEKTMDKKYVLRRLTPTECARLQGFPDWWCDGANGSDSAQYKLWGNGIALPCAVMILGNIAEDAKNEG